MTGSDQVWNSLEVAKLVVAVTLPLTVAIATFLLGRSLKAYEQRFWRAQQSINWKQRLFDKVVGPLGKLYCAFTYVGRWGEMSASSIVEAKRELDDLIYGYRSLLARETIERYEEFVEASFEVRRGRGLSLRVRANVDMYRENSNWREGDADMFVARDQRTGRAEFVRAYDLFVSALFKDTGLMEKEGD